MTRLWSMLNRPVPGTVLYGAAAGLGYALVVGASWLPAWGLVFKLFVWAVLAGYAWLLTGWSGRGRVSALLPLALLLFLALTGLDPSAHLLLCLAGLAWVRGQAAHGHRGLVLRRALLEGLLTVGGAFGVAALAPASLTAVGLAVWGFFCLQAAYFLLLPGAQGSSGEASAADGPCGTGPTARTKADSFESAHRSLNRLLNQEA